MNAGAVTMCATEALTPKFFSVDVIVFACFSECLRMSRSGSGFCLGPKISGGGGKDKSSRDFAGITGIGGITISSGNGGFSSGCGVFTV